MGNFTDQISIQCKKIFLNNEDMFSFKPYLTHFLIRSSATGAHNGFSKVGAALGTFLTEYLDSIKISHSITVLVVVLVISSVATIFLQLETKDKSLADGNDSTEMTVRGTNLPLDDRRIRVSMRGGANATDPQCEELDI